MPVKWTKRKDGSVVGECSVGRLLHAFVLTETKRTAGLWFLKLDGNKTVLKKGTKAECKAFAEKDLKTAEEAHKPPPRVVQDEPKVRNYPKEVQLAGKAKAVRAEKGRDWYFLEDQKGIRVSEGSFKFVEEANERMRHTGYPLVRTLRKEDETVKDYFVRMARRYGYCPKYLSGCEYVMKAARINPEKLSKEFLDKVTKLTWPIAKQRLEKEMGVLPDGSFWVNKERNYWFGISGDLLRKNKDREERERILNEQDMQRRMPKEDLSLSDL